MDAWELLTKNSTLAEGDVWEHLNAQGGAGDIVFVSEFTVDVANMTMEAGIIASEFEVVLQSEWVISIDESTILEVSGGQFGD